MAQSKFYESEKKRQIALLDNQEIVSDAKGGGKFRNHTYDHILEDGNKNLHPSIKDFAIQYFSENGIAWWNGASPTGNLLSSQVACLNHLMPIRNDEEIILNILNHLQSKVKFTKVYPIVIDKNPTFIGFEMVSKIDHLNEGFPNRGTNCTSIDAFIFAEDENSQRWLIPIEWKYTENYSLGKSADKSTEDRDDAPKGNHEKGLERQKRYNKLISSSKQLKIRDNYEGSVYYFEPFYQLMRQTLWAEQMIQHKDEEDIKADNFLHIHVVPKNNTPLLGNKYWGKKTMKETWSEMLVEPDKYLLIDPKDFLTPIKEKYPEIWSYLQMRYF